MPNPDFGNGEAPGPEWDESEAPDHPDFAYICKHCPAVAGECPQCDGEGAETSEGSMINDDRPCPHCGGTGIVEGLAFTEWREDPCPQD